MTERRDSLGRKIPTYDRSAAAKLAQKNRKEREGADVHARIGASGGRKRTRGYFGKLKDEGRADEIKSISRKGYEKSLKAINESRRRKSDSVDSDSERS